MHKRISKMTITLTLDQLILFHQKSLLNLVVFQGLEM